jgi:MFS superfamily sulfate permease-like transporter
VIALFAGLLCYGLIGRSRFAIVTATSSSSAVLASATLASGAASLVDRVALAGVLVIGGGIAFVIAGVLRLGAMSNLIARPVLRGYAFGLALVIAVKQWPLMVNLPAHAGNLFTLLGELLLAYRSWHLPSLCCGLAALLGLFVFERLPRVPGALVVIALSISVSPWLTFHHITLTGPITLAIAAPALALPPTAHWLPLVEISLALMFILYAESYSSIRTCALRHSEPVYPNRDLLALGVANLVSGLFHGTPVGAGYSGTSANEAAGAQTRLAGLLAALLILALVLLLLPWIERIPEPVLAAIVIHAVSRSLRVGVFANYLRWRRDRLIAGAAVIAVVVLGVLNGLLAAIAVSILMLLKSLASPRLSQLGRMGEHDYVSLSRFPGAAISPQLLILRPEEPLFFANAEPLMTEVRQRVLAAPQTVTVVLSLEESPDLDSTALESLADIAGWLQSRRIGLRLARLKDDAYDALMRARISGLSGEALDYSSVDDAVQGHPARSQGPSFESTTPEKKS